MAVLNHQALTVTQLEAAPTGTFLVIGLYVSRKEEDGFWHGQDTIGSYALPSNWWENHTSLIVEGVPAWMY